ncbi:GH92 family glycosyl hydrolase [Rarobacter incanus]|uniref:Putative alpha-1,2-mannosidase n=1 Tax=Rarobacter incanus TaxID=153494 RepID=A0A542SQU9_9MICO|nr:GH92 family glycosyl hydrolase [Rarobacter incanus]TQK76990.1 putative alpha-1,2-mannosidase [Rarobacter incanus]
MRNRSPHVRRKPFSILLATVAAGAVAVTGGVAAAPTALAASLDQTAWHSSFDSTADPTGFKTSVADGTYTNLSGKSFSKGSLSGFIAEAKASTEPNSGESSAKLYDGDPETKWFGGSSSAWVQYKLSQAKTATKYILALANDATGRNPKNWTLEGSSDGNSWTTLDTQSNQLGTEGGAPSYFTRHEFTIPSGARGSYTYYRLNVTATHGESAVQLGEFELIDGSSNEVYKQGNWNTYKSSGPRDSRVAKTGVGFTGSGSLEYKGFDTADGAAKGTNVLYSDLDLEIGTQTELSYKIFPTLDELSLDYSSTYVAVDVEYTDADGSNTKRMSTTAGLTDQYGFGVSAAEQGAAKTLYGRQWNSVRVDLSSLQGKRVKRILLTYDNPQGTNDAEAWGWIDDIKLAKATPIDSSSYTNYVDTRRGTNSNGAFSRGNNYPAVAVPNGFNFVTPLTQGGSRDDLYKYQESNNGDNRPRLQGIGLSHEPSRWITDRNQLQVMPSTTSDSTPNGDLVARELSFSHDNEVAQPDEYSVDFDNGIKAKTTATSHAVIFNFTFPAGAASRTVFLDKVWDNASFTIGDNNTFTGWMDGSTAGATRMFVYGQFSSAVTKSGTAANRSSAKYFQFNSDTVELRLATSMISVDQAKKNFNLEIAGKSYQDVQTAAQSKWDERLGVIDVTGATDVEKVNLYSNLYRLNLFPNEQHENTGTAEAPVWKYASPVNAGSGSASDTQTNAPIKSGKMYVNNGFWDTYRTAWPMYSYLYPDVAAELTDGFVNQYEDGGWIARWSAPGYDNQMTGTSSDASFADAYIQGDLTTAEAEKAYEAALKNATALNSSNVKSDGNYDADRVGRKSLSTSIFLGYTPASQDQSVSWGLEGLINDYAIGKMAEKLSQNVTDSAKKKRYAEEASYFLTRAESYVNLFDSTVGDPDDSNTPLGFFTARDTDGSWIMKAGSYNLSNTTTVYNPEDWNAGNGTRYNNHTYTETDGWNFAFHAPYDVDGLASLYGGKDGLVQKLNTFFSTPEKAATRKIHETYEARDVRMGQWGASNQVSFHIPYLYAAAGNPAGTQKVVREAMSRLYVGSEIGQGYPGDEDNGAMASWYVFSALGFYPLAVGSGQYVIGSPLYDKVTISPLGTTDSLTITANNNSHDNIYIQSAKLDGSDLKTATVDQSQLTRGTHTLTFQMGSTASSWGETSLAAASPTPAVDVAKQDYASTSVAGLANAKALTDDNSTTEASLPAAASDIVVSALTPSTLTEYTITNSKSGADPTDWTLYGKSADDKWVKLDERSGQSFEWRTQTRPFAIENAGIYSEYKLSVTATTGGGATIAELELLSNKTTDTQGELKVTAASQLSAGTGSEFTGVLAGVSGVAPQATVDYGSGAVDATVTALRSGGYAISAPTTFEKPGLYTATVNVTSGTQTATVKVNISVEQFSLAQSVAAAANVACFSEVGIGGSCDGQGYAYNKAAVTEAGVTFGTEQTVKIAGVDYYYTLPDVASGQADTMTGLGQTVSGYVNPDATKISVLGSANEGAQAMMIYLNFTDGTTQAVRVGVSDWVGGVTDLQEQNTLVFNAPGRLAGTGTESTVKNAGVFATAPVAIDKDSSGKVKTIKSISLENQGTDVRAGKAHIMAFAFDASAASTLVANAVTEPATAGAGQSQTLTLATTSGGTGSVAANINWGDGSPIEAATISGGTVTGTHTYTAKGTYTVTTTVYDAAGATTYTRIVTVEGKDASTTVLTASASQVEAGGQVTLVAVVAPATATGKVEFFQAGASLGAVDLEGGSAAKTVTLANPGTQTFTAKYLGDDNVLESSSQSVGVVVTPKDNGGGDNGGGDNGGGDNGGDNAGQTITVSKPVIVRGTQVYGASAAKRAALSVTVKNASTGTVEFRVGSRSLGTVKLAADGKNASAKLTLPAKLPVGSYVGIIAVVKTAKGTVVSDPTTAKITVTKAKLAKVKVKGKKFKKGTKPKVKITLGRLSNGARPVGKIKIKVGKKVVRTVTITAKKNGKVTVKLPKKYSKTIKVKATFVPKSKSTVAGKSSKATKVKVRK